MHRQMADVMKKMGGMGKKGLLRGGLGALFGKGGRRDAPAGWPSPGAMPAGRRAARPASRSRPVSPGSAEEMTAPRLATGRLTLRPHCMDDWEAMAAFFESDAARFIGGPMPRRQSWNVFAGDVGSWDLLGYGGWAIEETASAAFVVDQQSAPNAISSYAAAPEFSI